jgi:hypothetical protein
VYEWIEMFKDGRTHVTDAECLGCPTTTAQNEETATELILQNRRVMVDKTAKQMNISSGSAYSVVHDNLSSIKCVPSGYALRHLFLPFGSLSQRR